MNTYGHIPLTPMTRRGYKPSGLTLSIQEIFHQISWTPPPASTEDNKARTGINDATVVTHFISKSERCDLKIGLGNLDERAPTLETFVA